MYRLRLIIVFLLFGAAISWAQEDETENETSEPVAEEAAEADIGTDDEEVDITDEEIDELLGLDEDYAEIEDEDIESTQEVRFEQNVVFPVDI